MNKIFTVFRRIFTSVLPKKVPVIRVYAYQLFNRAKETNDEFKNKRKVWYNPHVLLKSYMNYTNTMNQTQSESRGLHKMNKEESTRGLAAISNESYATPLSFTRHDIEYADFNIDDMETVESKSVNFERDHEDFNFEIETHKNYNHEHSDSQSYYTKSYFDQSTGLPDHYQEDSEPSKLYFSEFTGPRKPLGVFFPEKILSFSDMHN